MREPAREVPPEKPKPAAVVRKEPPPPPALLPRPIWDLDSSLWRLSEEGRLWAYTLNCCIGGPLAQPTLALNIESRASTVGFVAGADLTTQGLFSGFIAGVTAGYTWSELKLNTTATSIDQPLVGTGVSHLRATASGPTAGLYATYFSAGFSTDLTVKFDFLTLNGDVQ